MFRLNPKNQTNASATKETNVLKTSLDRLIMKKYIIFFYNSCFFFKVRVSYHLWSRYYFLSCWYQGRKYLESNISSLFLFLFFLLFYKYLFIQLFKSDASNDLSVTRYSLIQCLIPSPPDEKYDTRPLPKLLRYKSNGGFFLIFPLGRCSTLSYRPVCLVSLHFFGTLFFPQPYRFLLSFRWHRNFFPWHRSRAPQSLSVGVSSNLYFHPRSVEDRDIRHGVTLPTEVPTVGTPKFYCLPPRVTQLSRGTTLICPLTVSLPLHNHFHNHRPFP